MNGEMRYIRKVELVVLVLCVVILIGSLGAAGTGGRERAKRLVCQTNLRQLILAWTRYADDNDDNLVSGDAGEYGYLHPNETPWVLLDWAGTATIAQKQQAVRNGALFPYAGDLRLYRCPVAPVDETRSYAIVDSMNCKDWLGSDLIRKRSEIEQPAERFVFIDCGGTQILVGGGWTCYPDGTERWWDPPPIRHNDGTTFSFADGHVEHWQWKDPRTIEFGQRIGALSELQPDNQDIRNTQLGVWGEVKDEPTGPTGRR